MSHTHTHTFTSEISEELAAHIHQSHRLLCSTVTAGHRHDVPARLGPISRTPDKLKCFDPVLVLSQGNRICTQRLELIRSSRTAHHYTFLTLSLTLSNSSPPPTLFSSEPADWLDVPPARRPHRLPGVVSEESQGARGNGQGALGYVCGPGEEVPPTPQWRSVPEVHLQERWAVRAGYFLQYVKNKLLCCSQAYCWTSCWTSKINTEVKWMFSVLSLSFWFCCRS